MAGSNLLATFTNLKGAYGTSVAVISYSVAMDLLKMRMPA